MSETEEIQEKPIKKSSRGRRVFAGFIAGFLLGALVLGAIRYVTFKDDHVHYHANFALYVDGTRDEFKLPTYYEEVQACGTDSDNPRSRGHMHDNDSYSIHIHDHAVTWSNFFSNLGYTLGNNVVATSSQTYVDGQDGKRLSFYLNGEKVPTVANQVIGDQDVLLVSYGSEDQAAVKKQYESIPHTAKKLDESKDPAACSGSAGPTSTDRLKAAVGLQ